LVGVAAFSTGPLNERKNRIRAQHTWGIHVVDEDVAYLFERARNNAIKILRLVVERVLTYVLLQKNECP
jgi:hypothetical protein